MNKYVISFVCCLFSLLNWACASKQKKWLQTIWWHLSTDLKKKPTFNSEQKQEEGKNLQNSRCFIWCHIAKLTNKSIWPWPSSINTFFTFDLDSQKVSSFLHQSIKYNHVKAEQKKNQTKLIKSKETWNYFFYHIFNIKTILCY